MSGPKKPNYQCMAHVEEIDFTSRQNRINPNLGKKFIMENRGIMVGRFLKVLIDLLRVNPLRL